MLIPKMNHATKKNFDVLIVDDHPFVAHSAGLLFRALGVDKVAVARNGREAREMLVADHPADLILCDLSMPEEDGLVFLRWLAKQETQPAVVLMSGEDPVVLSAAKRLAESRNLHIGGVVEKPLSRDVLEPLIEKVLGPRAEQGRKRDGLRLDAADIRECLDNRHFDVWFQPQIETGTRKVCGFEALARLNHPTHGLVGPDSFIGPAEESGDIVELTDFVIRESVEWCAAWHRVDPSLSVSINLSARALDDPAFPDRLAEIVRRNRLAPGNIVLELTESALAGDQDVLLEIMARMRLMKFKLSIDDFGTGFSSLEQLKELPFHELKVDRSFVFDAVEDQRSGSILENSLRLASSLNLTSVAEGVETTAHLDLVTKLGCDRAQGYLIAKPLPAKAIAKWLTDYHPKH